MTDNVVQFTGVTRLDCDPDQVLQSAVGKLECAIIIGWDKDDMMYFASSKSDGAEVLWLMEKAKLALLAGGE